MGTPLTLTALPATGSTFVGWSGACSGTGTCQLPMGAATAVTAQFIRTTYVLTLLREGNGNGAVTSSPSGINCGSACSATYGTGVSVTLTAKPAIDSVFTGWSGACSGTGACVVTMSAARHVSAEFTRTHYTLTTTVTGSTGGRVTSATPAIDCGAGCANSLPVDTAVTLSAQPTAGWSFDGWSGACSGTGPCSVTMTHAINVSAKFSRITHPLTVAKTGTGTGSVLSSPGGISCGSTCSRAFNQGVAVTLTATPNSTALFVGWSGACSGSGTCSVTIDGAKAVSAEFRLK